MKNQTKYTPTLKGVWFDFSAFFRQLADKGYKCRNIKCVKVELSCAFIYLC